MLGGSEPLGEIVHQQPHLGREVAVVGIEGPDPLRRRPQLGQQLDKLAAGQMVTDVVVRQLNDADPLERRIEQGVPAVALQQAVYPPHCGNGHPE